MNRSNISSGNAPPADPNTLIISRYYNATLTQHAETQRWIYTVPANRKFSLDGLSFNIQMIAALGADHAAYSVVAITPNGGGQVKSHGVHFDSQIFSGVDTLGVSPGSILSAGDVIELLTYVEGIGGDEFLLMGALTGTEFDA